MDHTPVHAPVHAGISRKHRWSKRILKAVLSIVIIGLVLRSQVNRPKTPIVYNTSNPYDTSRNGINYTCGCTLPATMQARLQVTINPTDNSNVTFKSEHNSSWTNSNLCQDSTTTVTSNVLMYPDFTRVGDPKFTQYGILDDILQDAYGPDFTTKREKKKVPGYLGEKQGHDISWHNNKFLEPLQDIYVTKPPKQRQLKVPVDYLNNTAYPQSGDAPQYTAAVTPFLDFPTSYVNLAFAYNCTDCSRCPLETVNQIFRNISGDFNSTWGSCDYWWNTAGNPCNASQNWYTAKCVLYPTDALPLNYALQDFLQELTKLLSGTDNIFTPEDLADKNGTEGLLRSQTSKTSFSANVLHMQFSKVTNDSIQLNFFELEKYSGAWLTILDSFPTLDTECANLTPLNISNGTAICNVFTNAKTKALDTRCIPMSNKSLCEELYIRKNDTSVRVTLDAADPTLWSEFNVPQGHWADLMCMTSENVSVQPYKVLWKTAPAMQNSSLNQFLESLKWSGDWAQDSGVCINSYKDVSPQNFEEGNRNTTAFMETQCHDAGYCWLTGRYHRITDTPGDPWHNITLENPPDLFVCYVFESQNVWIWLLFICAILFGWLGTLDLICEWIIFPISRLIWFNINKLLPKPDGTLVPSSPSTPRGSEELQGVVVMRRMYKESWSDTAVILGRRKPVELEICPPLDGIAGGSERGSERGSENTTEKSTDDPEDPSTKNS